MQKNSQTATYLAALATIILWSSAFAVTKYALDYFSPGALMFYRFLFASATLIIVGVFKKIRLPEKRDLPLFALGGFIGIFLYMLFFNFGATYVDSGISSLIISSSPVFAAITARIVLKEKVRFWSWVGIIISFGGIAIIALSQTQEYTLNIGVVFLLIAATTSGGHNVVQRLIVKKYTALEATTYSVLFATLFMVVFTPSLVRELPNTTLTANLFVIYLGIFPAAAAYFLWAYALSKAKKTSSVAVFLYLIPFLSVLIGYLWLGEVLSLWAILGGAVVIGGMMLSNAKKTQ